MLHVTGSEQRLKIYKVKLTNVLPTKGKMLQNMVTKEALAFMGWGHDNREKCGELLAAFSGRRPSEIRLLLATSKRKKNPQGYFLYMLGMTNKRKNTKI